mmetsp:Transcript_35972/g.72176  ORF Transcript_35972/g.72176 Transcript_35972/m.72176 type:complete len:360 (+) Transcript_35972:33-1112(+)
MKRRPKFQAMVIKADEEEEEQQFKSSLSVTAGGSLQVRDFHLNAGGISSGIKFDELEFGSVLGKGASSVVHKATHVPTGQKVACKMLTNVWDKELRKQLVAEMQFLKPKLRDSPCPFLLQIYDAYWSEEKTYIVLEFCGNGALDDCLEKCGPMPEAALSVCIRSIFLGLCYLYNNGIVHRDMKPGNCLVDDNGVVKISDFGSSKDCNGNNLQSPAMTDHGDGADGMATTFTGTMRYMSPERLNGQPYSWPADVWCAGMILLELGMGDHPYKVAFAGDTEGSSFLAMLEYAAQRETPQLPDHYSDEAKEFANLCLLKDPSQRPRPPVMVNEADEDSSHPFIVNYKQCGPDEVLGWLGKRG